VARQIQEPFHVLGVKGRAIIEKRPERELAAEKLAPTHFFRNGECTLCFLGLQVIETAGDSDFGTPEKWKEDWNVAIPK